MGTTKSIEFKTNEHYNLAEKFLREYFLNQLVATKGGLRSVAEEIYYKNGKSSQETKINFYDKGILIKSEDENQLNYLEHKVSQFNN